MASWLALRGRCRTCQEPIGWRHPIAELAVGVLWAITAWQFVSTNPTPNFGDLTYTFNLANAAAELIFQWLLVALAVIDAENLWLPDRLILPGVVVSLLLNVVRGSLISFLQYHGGFDVWKHLAATAAVNWFLSAVFSAAVIVVIRWAYIIVRGMEGLGMGDVKLMAMLGGWIGFKPAMLAFAIGVLLCTAYAFYLLSTSPQLRTDKRTWAETKLPLGAFISFGGVIAGLWGIPIVAAFSRWASH